MSDQRPTASQPQGATPAPLPAPLVMRAVRKHVANPGLVLIDTHLDTALEVGGEELNHCCPIKPQRSWRMVTLSISRGSVGSSSSSCRTSRTVWRSTGRLMRPSAEPGWP